MQIDPKKLFNAFTVTEVMMRGWYERGDCKFLFLI